MHECRLTKLEKYNPEEWDYFTPIYGDNVYGMVCEGKTLGMVELIPMGEECHIGFTEVKKEHRGQGIGKDMIHRLARIGRKMGCKEFTASAEPEAIGFWEKMGFQNLGEDEGMLIISKKGRIST